MDIISQVAKELGNLKTTLQEVEQSGYRSAESIFGKFAQEIFGNNTLKDRLYNVITTTDRSSKYYI